MGKCNYCQPHLGFIPHHEISYNPDLGIALLLAVLCGVLLVWYFGRVPGFCLEFMKLISSAYLVNVES